MGQHGDAGMSDPRNHPCADCGYWFGAYGIGELFPLSATRWRCRACARASGLFASCFATPAPVAEDRPPAPSSDDWLITALEAA